MPIKSDTEYFGRNRRQRTIKFRVVDLDAAVMELRAAGIDRDVDLETYPNRRFARLYDSEQNPLQLWEPDGADPWLLTMI